MRNRVYFYANFGDWNKPPYGGGEAGNRKTLELFQKMDIDIVLIPKFLHKEGNSFFKTIIKVFRVLGGLMKFFFTLLFGRRIFSIVHISGYYGKRLHFEYILFRIAKLLGYRIVYEMRAGGAIEQYNKLGKKYRRDFNHIISNCDAVFSQGLENYPLLKSIKKDVFVFYYPNFVTEGFYPTSYPDKTFDTINFVYFGRLSKQKNIDLIIDIFDSVASTFSNIHLLLIGNFIDTYYEERIKHRINLSRYSKKIQLIPACARGELRAHLQSQHFFLFPTNEPGEGHSNALTEAMSWGIVPFASSHGFNRSVIANDNLILTDFDASHWATSIETVIDNKEFTSLSRQVYNRVVENYTETTAYKRLTDVYSSLFTNLF